MMFCPRHDAAPSSRRFDSSSSSIRTRRRPPKRECRPLALESLEPRLALSADLGASFDAALTHGGACACPICSGQGLEQLMAPQAAETIAAAATASGATSLTSVPALSSNPSARVKLYLDFNGNVQGTWGSWSNVRTPAFDQDGNAASYSTSELSAIREIWARVAEDYSPFQIDVTTVEPASFADRTAVRVAIGGNWSDWFGSSAGGVAYVGGFTNSAPNIAFVFAKALGNGSARYVAEAASHEAGHLFGLSHQSTYAGSALSQTYNSGTSALAPIMGVGYYSSRTTWFNGPTDSGPAALQDDVSILAGANNGFGRRPDDFGDTLSTASQLTVAGGAVNVRGVIEDQSDSDVWKFTTGGGTARLTLNVAQYGANLDSVLELKNATGQVIASSNLATSLGGSLTATLAAGTYYVVARSSGGYGNMGQYTLTGSLPASGGTSGSTSGSGGTASAGAPEITIAVNGSQVADGGQVNFGTTTAGKSVTRTITIINHGSRALSLSPIARVPTGYSIVTNVGTSSLAPGQSTSFVIRLNASSTGTFTGRVTLANGDSNEGQYDLNLSGTVNRAATTTTTSTPSGNAGAARTIDNGQSGYTATGAWSTKSGSGHSGDLQSAARSTSGATAKARFNFSGLAAGTYRVWLTWTAGGGNAGNAPASFYDGSRLMRTVTFDQRTAPSGLSADGSTWKLITTMTISGSQLVVQLGNNANGMVIADAVRIERVAAAASTPADPGLSAAAIFGQSSAGAAHHGDESRSPAEENRPLPSSSVDALFAEEAMPQYLSHRGRSWDWMTPATTIAVASQEGAPDHADEQLPLDLTWLDNALGCA